MKRTAAEPNVSRHTGLFVCCIALVLAAVPPVDVHAAVLDFETLPDGTPTVDTQEISDQYAAYGVTFELLDPATGDPVGFPRIAKAGPPRTAFNGCYDYDLPDAGQGVGHSFLTDNTSIGISTDLLIRYSPFVSSSSGVILDIDCRTNGGPPCEQWTITARDAFDTVLGTVVLDGPAGAPRPECMNPEGGPGNAKAFTWSFDLPGQEIASVLLQYTGTPTDVGLAFDNFSVAASPGPPDVEIDGPPNEICAGQTVELLAVVSGGYAPYAHQWQEEAAPGSWTDLGTGPSQLVNPGLSTSYRVRVTDDAAQDATSDPYTVHVVSGSGEPACNGYLLVSAYDSDRVLRYDPVTMSFVDAFVPEASGGLDGPSGLDFGLDGYLFVVSQRGHGVLRYDGQTGAFLDVFVPSGSGGLAWPVGLVVGSDGHVYVASSDNDRVMRYDGQTGAYLGDFVVAGSGGLDNPTGLTFGPDGDLFVCGRNNNAVKRYDGQTGAYIGDFVRSGAGGLSQPRGLTFGPDGDLYVGSQSTNDVKRYDGRTGEPLGRFVSANAGTLSRSNDVLFGRAGNLFVVSLNNDKVLRYGGRSGAFIDAFPQGNGLDRPSSFTSTLYCGDDDCDGGIGEDACSCAGDCGPPQPFEWACDDGLDDDCDGAPDCADTDCASEAPCSPAGSVPDGSRVPGTMLTVDKAGDVDITLLWDASCRSSDSDYEIYEGWIGTFTSHQPATCSTAGSLTWTFTPEHGDTYYLVVASNGSIEGSYGTDSGGVERPRSDAPCLTQIVGPCD
jgi:DNA-binding beta-propeller fold protein YncE